MWRTCLEGRSKAGEIFVLPVSHPFKVLQYFRSSGPAALWIACHTKQSQPREGDDRWWTHSIDTPTASQAVLGRVLCRLVNNVSPTVFAEIMETDLRMASTSRLVISPFLEHDHKSGRSIVHSRIVHTRARLCRLSIRSGCTLLLWTASEDRRHSLAQSSRSLSLGRCPFCYA